MDRPLSLPRLVIAGLSGDAGKTLVSTGLGLLFGDRGVPVCPFKKGPDYIDAAWLTWATGQAARNLDTYLMGAELVRSVFMSHATADGVNLVEGNRGLFDGSDARGTHSTAQLAKLLRAPVVLVVDAAKSTSTVAACVLGCQALDPDVRIAGVILNRVAGRRHQDVLRDAIESICEIPVVGAIPRADSPALMPGRHLGLVTPHENADREALADDLRDLLGQTLDVDRVLAIAREAPAMAIIFRTDRDAPPGAESTFRETLLDAVALSVPVKVGYIRDSAFTFYYPDNLEALERAGAELVPVSALTPAELPDGLAALYIGGGFPETHATSIAANASFLRSIRAAADKGLPIYAECGGLMLLSRGIWWHGRKYAMAGVLPFDVEMQPKPQGHGYTHLRVDGPNPFFPDGTAFKGHEFHYSRVLGKADCAPTACAVLRGSGCFAGRDGVVVNQAFAAYTHVHALGTPEWAPGVLRAARRFASRDTR